MTHIPPPRLNHLRAYLEQLGADMASAGKFAAAGENKIEAYAIAILSGSGAMAVQWAADLKTIGGEKLAMARPIVEGVIAGTAARIATDLAGKGIEAIAKAFAGPPVVRREDPRAAAGRKIMEQATGGKRR